MVLFLCWEQDKIPWKPFRDPQCFRPQKWATEHGIIISYVFRGIKEKSWLYYLDTNRFWCKWNYRRHMFLQSSCCYSRIFQTTIFHLDHVRLELKICIFSIFGFQQMTLSLYAWFVFSKKNCHAASGIMWCLRFRLFWRLHVWNFISTELLDLDHLFWTMLSLLDSKHTHIHDRHLTADTFFPFGLGVLVWIERRQKYSPIYLTLFLFLVLVVKFVYFCLM